MTANIPNAREKLVDFVRQLGRRLGLSTQTRSPKKLEAFRVLKRRGVRVDAVVDVGVLHGTSELIDHFPRVHHYLFEPVDECRDAIERVYAGLDFTLFQKAVGSGDSVATMRILGEAGSLNSSAHVDLAEGGREARAIEVVALDSVAAKFGPVRNCLLKIDTDGNEVSVLDGARSFLSSCAVIVVEVTQANLAEVVARLTAEGFSIFDIVEPCYFDEALWQVDVIFLNNKSHSELFDTITDNDFDKDKYKIFK
ncbi:FkbM family methyltransferase [Maricaulis maris]|uniref:FkbM family methyltransferase n=1 Tax=Maricaulis maris TaxID=74318 RepID=UPI00291C696E|nr:hypothetical protein MACH15_24610 [Maricaulis maris]